MPAYWLFDNLEVLDPEGLTRYVAGAAESVAAHGGRYLVKAVTPEIVEGEPELSSAVLIAFPDRAAARAWYDSDDYAPLKALRRRSVRTTAVLLDDAPAVPETHH